MKKIPFIDAKLNWAPIVAVVLVLPLAAGAQPALSDSHTRVLVNPIPRRKDSRT